MGAATLAQAVERVSRALCVSAWLSRRIPGILLRLVLEPLHLREVREAQGKVGAPVRIWHLSSNRWNSAVTEYALSAALALANRGHETLFTPLDGSPAEKRALQLGLLTRSLPRFSPMEVGAARGIARDFDAEVVIAY